MKYSAFVLVGRKEKRRILQAMKRNGSERERDKKVNPKWSCVLLVD